MVITSWCMQFEPLCYTSETYTMLYVNYILIKLEVKFFKLKKKTKHLKITKP